MHRTILADARPMLPDCGQAGAVVPPDGRIADIITGAGVPRGAQAMDGDLLSPGPIALHTGALERHIKPRPGVGWPQGAATIAHDPELAGTGIPRVCITLRDGQVVPKARGNSAEDARAHADEVPVLRAAGLLEISRFLPLRTGVCSRSLIEDLAKFGPDGPKFAASPMDHIPGRQQFAGGGQMRARVGGKHGDPEGRIAARTAGQPALTAACVPAHQAASGYGARPASHDDATAVHVAKSAARGARLGARPGARPGACLAEFPPMGGGCRRRPCSRDCRDDGSARSDARRTAFRQCGGSRTGQGGVCYCSVVVRRACRRAGPGGAPGVDMERCGVRLFHRDPRPRR